jgi:hypothetical protein
MAGDLLCTRKAAPHGPATAALCWHEGKKSRKCGRFQTGKIIPSVIAERQPARVRNHWNGAAGAAVDAREKTIWRIAMYIGLGGLLILILILWLLGVI